MGKIPYRKLLLLIFYNFLATLTKGPIQPILFLPTRGGVLVSTLQVRQRRHAEDGSLASLITGPKKQQLIKN